ncbi:MAG: lysylphosphatidylglycerol synthase transmembrane domain-containing protein [Gemmatimonadaceae bacterium]
MKKHFRAVLGVTLSVALLWWTLHGVSLSRVVHELGRANPWLFAVATVLATLTFPLRARRWRTILDPIFPKLPFDPLWRSTAIGMMVNNVVPARAGEVARAYVLTRETKVPFATSIASLAVDRVFDAIVLLILAFSSLLDPRFPRGVRLGGQSVESWAIGGTVLVAILVALLYTLVFFPAQLIRVFEVFARKLSPKIEARGRAALETFAQGLSVLRSPGHFFAVFLWTVLHWLCNALSWWVSMKAVGIDVPFSATLLLQALVAMGVAVPAAPGYFGVFEAVGKLGLAIYAVPATLATSWALGFHILSFIPITLIGVYYSTRLGFNLKDLQTQPNAADNAAG